MLDTMVQVELVLNAHWEVIVQPEARLLRIAQRIQRLVQLEPLLKLIAHAISDSMVQTVEHVRPAVHSQTRRAQAH